MHNLNKSVKKFTTLEIIMLVFRFFFNTKFSTKIHQLSRKMSLSNSSKANLCYTKYDKERLKIIGIVFLILILNY
jgi:hypothetical protein